MSALEAWEELRRAAAPFHVEEHPSLTEDLYYDLKERDPGEGGLYGSQMEQHRGQVSVLREAVRVMGNYMASPAWDVLGDIAAAVGMPNATPAQVLEEVKRWKVELDKLRKDICHEVAARENDRIRGMLIEEERERLTADKRDLKTRPGALLAPVDVEATMTAVINGILDAPGDSIRTEHVRKAVRTHVEREAMLSREVERLWGEIAESDSIVFAVRSLRASDRTWLSTIAKLNEVGCERGMLTEARAAMRARPVLTRERAREMAEDLAQGLQARWSIACGEAVIADLAERIYKEVRGAFGEGEPEVRVGPEDGPDEYLSAKREARMRRAQQPEAPAPKLDEQASDRRALLENDVLRLELQMSAALDRLARLEAAAVKP